MERFIYRRVKKSMMMFLFRVKFLINQPITTDMETLSKGGEICNDKNWKSKCCKYEKSTVEFLERSHELKRLYLLFKDIFLHLTGYGG
jgi:hypothetical protein